MCLYCNFNVPLHFLINSSILIDQEPEDPATIPEVDSDHDLFITKSTVAMPEISVDDVQITDSSVGRELTFTVSLDAASNNIITVDYSTENNTAIAAKDYIAVNSTVTFSPGETSKTVVVKTTGTSFLDEDESFFLNLSNANNASIDDGQGTGTILPAYAGIRGGKRSQEIVTFSFFDEDVFGQGGYDGSLRESNAREVSEVVKANYRQIFKHLNTFVERQFVEVEESESQVGNIRIVVSDGPDYAYAGGHIHLAGWAAASDARSNGWESGQGVYAYAALMHELGHAIGMPHSFGKSSSVFDPEENSSNTVMSYTYPGSKPGTFMSYDIKSLQERYGAAVYRPEDTVYEFLTVDNYLVEGEIAVATTGRLKQTIWDSGGIDTFDFSGLEIDDSGYRFDLNQAQYQTTQDRYQGSSYTRNGVKYYVPSYGTSIAIDVEIENLINSSSDDLIIANPAANIFSGYGISLSTGHDRLINTNSLDTLDLSEFSFFDITKTYLANDLKIEFGIDNSIYIPDYANDKINILLSDNVNLSLNGVDSIVEGDDQAKWAKFQVNLAEANSEIVEVNYTTENGNAKAGQDYVAKTGKVVFNPGETSKNIAIKILGDTTAEAEEFFNLNLLGNQGQVIKQARGIIADNDGEFIPSLTISNATVTDGNNAAKANFVVRLDRPYNTLITVDYRTKDGLAIAGKDYIAQNGTLTFASGETEKTIEVDILGDLLSDRDQDFEIQLSNVSSNAKLTDNIGVGNIINPTLNIALANGGSTNLEIASYPPSGTKDPNNLAFAVTANHNNLSITGNGNGWKEIPLGESIDNGQKPLNPYSVIQFDFRSSSEGKLHGIHFEGTDHHAFYAPWEKGRFFQLYGSGEFGIQDFNNYEDSIGQWKTYQIPVHQYFDTNNWRNYGQWVVFAHEGDSEDSNTQFRNLQITELLPISVNQVALNEDLNSAEFTLTIPEASTEIITVDYATADDTAIAGKDYIATSGTVIFNPGETSKTIDVAINDDSLSEENEIFNLNLSNAAKAILMDQTTTATIADNDLPLPVISISDLNFNEGNTNKTATVTISLDKSGTETITIDYSTLNNTAVAESDYQPITGNIAFNPGETTKTIEVPIIGDLLNEADESFYFQIKNAVNAKINNTQAEVTLGNDDSLPQIEIEDAAVLSSIPVKDSNGKIKNTTGLLFEITLDAPSNQTITVDYETADGTAKAGEDYSARRKPLTFKPGETVKQVFVGVTLDDTIEADETLYLNLSQPVNALIKDEQAVGIIEETRSLSVSDLTVSEDGTEALFTVSLDQPSVQGVFVDYATADGTARAGSDYTETKGRLFIKAGEAKATIAVPLLNNKLTEADETFFLNLTKPKYVLIDDSQGQATITNDDPLLAENPGGIYQNLQLWLKADGNLNTNNGQIITWSDNSQLELDLEQNTVDSQPTLISNGLNYNPVLKFDGDDLLETINTLPADFAADSSVFVVTKHNANSYNFLFTLDDTGWGRYLAHMPWGGNIHFDAGGTGNGRLSIPYADSAAKEFNTWHFSSETGVGQSIFRNGLSLATDSNTQTPITQDRRFQIGRQYNGEIAEVIVFNQALATEDRLAVNSYLGIKYGLTIDQTTPTNYVNSEGEVIWDAATAGNYNYDVAGIALDLASGLNQPKSRSSNQDAIVTIEADDKVNGLEDGEALIWSNQGNLSNRVWQVQENQGDVGKVSISFDLSQLGQQLPLADYALQISSQDNFDNSQFHTTGRTITDNTLTFTGVDFDHGDYFTLDTDYSDRVAYSAGNRPQPQPMGEVGTISDLNHETKKIQLNHSYDNPVVLAMPLSYNGSDPAIARITEIQHDSFTVYAQEAEYKDGKHAPESLSYIVLEAGTWELPDGTLLEAGIVDTNSTTNSLWSEIDFASNFLTKPAVFSQVQTQNGEQFVRTRQQSNHTEGFQLAMEEEELLKPSGHATETIGWLAMETGTGDWGDLKYQAGHTGLRIDHTWDQIKFKQDFENAPNLFASLASFKGGDSAGLRYQNLDSSQVQIKVEEDQSTDSEIAHAKEIVDFLAISGLGDLTALAQDAAFI